MGICVSKPGQTAVKKDDTYDQRIRRPGQSTDRNTYLPIKSSGITINAQFCSPAPVNKTTRFNGIGTLCDKTRDVLNESRITHTIGGRYTTSLFQRTSKIPVALWRSSPKTKTSANRSHESAGKVNDQKREYAPDGDGNLEKGNGCSDCNGFADKRPAVNSSSFTVTDWTKKTSCKPNIIHVKQVQKTQKAIFNQANRLLAAEINRQQQLNLRVQKARQSVTRCQDSMQRRLAIIAEQHAKFTQRQIKFETAALKDQIKMRLKRFEKE